MNTEFDNEFLPATATVGVERTTFLEHQENIDRVERLYSRLADLRSRSEKVLQRSALSREKALRLPDGLKKTKKLLEIDQAETSQIDYLTREEGYFAYAIQECEAKTSAISEMDVLRGECSDLMTTYCFKNDYRFTPDLVDAMCQWKLAYQGPKMNRYQKVTTFIQQLQQQNPIVPIMVKTLIGDILPIDLQYNPLKTPIHLIKQLHAYDPETFPLHHTTVTRMMQDGPVQEGELFCAICSPAPYHILDVQQYGANITFRVPDTHQSFQRTAEFKFDGTLISWPDCHKTPEFISYLQSRINLYL